MSLRRRLSPGKREFASDLSLSSRAKPSCNITEIVEEDFLQPGAQLTGSGCIPLFRLLPKRGDDGLFIERSVVRGGILLGWRISLAADRKGIQVTAHGIGGLEELSKLEVHEDIVLPLDVLPRRTSYTYGVS